ncbi:MAG: hypothetical protein HOQ27_01775 [Dermatophilaceae bacterium]|nr:hypothetical protein [Dermatophilaceae bacterium]
MPNHECAARPAGRVPCWTWPVAQLQRRLTGSSRIGRVRRRTQGAHLGPPLGGAHRSDPAPGG